MIKRTFVTMALFAFITIANGTVAAEVPLLKDVTSVITLLGMPCGEVVAAKRQNENDHIASCKNGNRYRVYVNGEGRVVAQKQ